MKFMKTSLAVAASLMVAMCAPAFADVGISDVGLIEMDVGQSSKPMAARSIEPVAFFDAYELEINALEAINLAFDIQPSNPALPNPYAQRRILRDSQAGLNLSHKHSSNCSHAPFEIGWFAA